MKLPKLDDVATEKLTLGGIELTFRHAIMSDYEYLNRMALEGVQGLESNLKVLARVMHGYDESEEERLKFLRKLPIENIGMAAETDKILTKIGFAQGNAVKEKETDPKKKQSDSIKT